MSKLKTERELAGMIMKAAHRILADQDGLMQVNAMMVVGTSDLVTALVLKPEMVDSFNEMLREYGATWQLCGAKQR